MFKSRYVLVMKSLFLNSQVSNFLTEMGFEFPFQNENRVATLIRLGKQKILAPILALNSLITMDVDHFFLFE